MSTSLQMPPRKRLDTFGAKARMGAGIIKAKVVAKNAAKVTATCTAALEEAFKFHCDQEFIEATALTYDGEARRNQLFRVIDRNKQLLVREQMARSIPSTMPAAHKRETPWGFSNFTGSHCYRSSLLQCLFNTPKFVQWLQLHHKPEDCTVPRAELRCVTCAMRRLSELYWEPHSRENRKNMNSYVQLMHRVFSSVGWRTHSENGHGDPEDQLVWIVEQMREENPRPIFAKFEAVHNLLLRSEIKCEKCEYASTSEGHEERLLSVPISPRQRGDLLQSYINAYMDEIIDDYTCDKCKHKSSKHRKQYIEYAPDVLLIQLKRFDYTGRKDIGKVVFEHTIDLSRYARSGIGGLKYKLASVIDHYGNTNWGHYTATVNVHRQEWVEFDDDNTHPLDPVEALTAAARFTPYLLFYKRDLEHRG